MKDKKPNLSNGVFFMNFALTTPKKTTTSKQEKPNKENSYIQNEIVSSEESVSSEQSPTESPTTTIGATTKTEKENMNTLWLVIIALVVLVLSGSITYYLLTKFKRR